MNETLKITRWCFKNFIWNELAENGGIYWMSEGSYLLKYLVPNLPPIEFVTDFSPSNVTLGPLQTIYDGRADMDFDDYQITEGRFQFVDFLYPTVLEKREVFIYTSAQGANFIKDT